MWAKLDDGLLDHPKILAAAARLGGADSLTKAIGAYTGGLLYAAKHLTDGFLSNSVVRRLHLTPAAPTMVAVGLWERVHGGFQIHDFGDYNPSARQVRRQRRHNSKVRAAAGALGGKARWGNGKTGHGK